MEEIRKQIYNPSRLMTLEEISNLTGVDVVIIKKHLRSGKLIDQTEENVRDYIVLLEMNKERYSSKDRYNDREQRKHHKWKIEDEIALSRLKSEEYIEFIPKTSDTRENVLEKTENENGKLP